MGLYEMPYFDTKTRSLNLSPVAFRHLEVTKQEKTQLRKLKKHSQLGKKNVRKWCFRSDRKCVFTERESNRLG